MTRKNLISASKLVLTQGQSFPVERYTSRLDEVIIEFIYERRKMYFIYQKVKQLIIAVINPNESKRFKIHSFIIEMMEECKTVGLAV